MIKTVKELKNEAMVRGLEGLGGYHWELDANKFADLLVTEISKWGEMNGALSPGVDEDALRESLGIR